MKTPTDKPELLSGGNPRIAKGEGDGIDAAQLTGWVKQAAAIPGWMA